MEQTTLPRPCGANHRNDAATSDFIVERRHNHPGVRMMDVLLYVDLWCHRSVQRPPLPPLKTSPYMISSCSPSCLRLRKRLMKPDRPESRLPGAGAGGGESSVAGFREVCRAGCSGITASGGASRFVSASWASWSSPLSDLSVVATEGLDNGALHRLYCGSERFAACRCVACWIYGGCFVCSGRHDQLLGDPSIFGIPP